MRHLWLAVVVAPVPIAFALDNKLNVWISQPIASGQCKAALASARTWGEAPTILVILAACILVQPTNWRWPVRIAIATALVAFTVEAIKPISGRLRPEQVQASNLDGSWHVGQGRNSSFPSGHVATAFAFARGLSTAYPVLQPLTVIAATGTAASRMRDGRHYASDCLVGAYLGWILAGAAISAMVNLSNSLRSTSTLHNRIRSPWRRAFRSAWLASDSIRWSRQ